MTPSLRAALAYADRLGWAVFPCHGKAPAVPRHQGGRGLLDASADPEEILRLWALTPRADGVGMSTPGLLVLDVDPRSGGDDELEALVDRHGDLPHTPQQITGGGGAHFVFAVHPGMHWRARIAPGLDLKAGGTGYIIVAPSVHPETRQRYAWDYDAHPIGTPVAPAPEWLVRMGSAPLVRPVELTGRASTCFVARAMAAAGFKVRTIDDRRAAVECPWSHHHTTDGSTSTVVLAPSRRDPLGRFHCSHAGCSEIDTTSLLAILPPAALGVATTQRTA